VRRAGLEPGKDQIPFLECDDTYQILTCCRQWGKSTLAGAKAWRKAVQEPGSLILIFAAAERQSIEMLRKAKDLGSIRKDDVDATRDNQTMVEFANGSRIVALPANHAKVRSFSAPDMMIIDEAAVVPDALYRSVRPMRATKPDSPLILMSSPFGKQGFFYRAWANPSGIWTKFSVTGHECPRITKDFLEVERDELGPIWFEQEYECKFIDLMTAIFTDEMISEAMSTDKSPLFATTDSIPVAADKSPLFARG